MTAFEACKSCGHRLVAICLCSVQQAMGMWSGIGRLAFGCCSGRYVVQVASGLRYLYVLVQEKAKSFQQIDCH